MKALALVLTVMTLTACTTMSNLVTGIKDKGVSVESASLILDVVEDSAEQVKQYRSIANSIINAKGDYLKIKAEAPELFKLLSEDDQAALLQLDLNLTSAYEIALNVREHKSSGELVISVIEAQKLMKPIRHGIKQATAIGERNKEIVPENIRSEFNRTLGGWVVLDAQLLRAQNAINGSVRASRIRASVATLLSLFEIIRTIAEIKK